MKSATVLAFAASAAAIKVFTPEFSPASPLFQKRQGGLDSEECVSALSSLMPLATSIPTPPPELTDALATVTITDPCEVPTDLPADVEEQISSYTSELLDWYSSHSAEINSALSQCPEFTSYMTDTPVCTDGVAGGGGAAATTTGSNDSEATETGAAGSSSDDSGSSSGSGSGSGSSGSDGGTSGAGSVNAAFAAGIAGAAFLAGVLAL